MAKLIKIEDVVIYKDEHYNTFPNLIKLQDGTILAGFRQAVDRRKELGHATHVDPTSKAVCISSYDGGATWSSSPTVIFDDEHGEQDPCLNLLSDGTVLCTFFKWSIAKAGEGENVFGKEKFKKLGRTVFDLWDGLVTGAYSTRSFDGGKTWDSPILIEVPGFIHGIGVRGNTIEMDDGSIILPMYGMKNYGETSRIFVMKSFDKGMTWTFLSDVAHKEDRNFYEPFVLRTRSGKLIALLRTQRIQTPGVDFDSTYMNLHTCISEDNGNTWSQPEERTILGSNPFHALQLSSGNVLITYGYRRLPYGMRARLTDGELINLDTADELVLRDDSLTTDLGYSSAVQLEDGRILVSYYYSEIDEIRYIAGTLLEEI